MSYRVKRFTVGKGRTVTHEENGEWIREYYELEVEIPEESELSIARENALGLLNEWLGIVKETPQQKYDWNPEAIKWVKAEGFKGEYERAEDINNLQFKAMVKSLAEHNGKLSRNGFFYWLFKNGSVVGRKRRVKR